MEIACVMLVVGIFESLFIGWHLGISEWSIIGNIWMVGGIIVALMSNKEVT
jgi:hypothetical protein